MFVCAHVCVHACVCARVWEGCVGGVYARAGVRVGGCACLRARFCAVRACVCVCGCEHEWNLCARAYMCVRACSSVCARDCVRVWKVCARACVCMRLCVCICMRVCVLVRFARTLMRVRVWEVLFARLFARAF